MLFRTSISLVVLAIATGAASAQGIQWRHDLNAAQQEAAQSGKLVLLHFWDTSCAPCMALDKTVFNQPQVGSAIERLYVPVKVDPTMGRQLAQTYGVTRIPTDVVLSSDGKMIRSLISPNTPMAYVSELTQVANSYAASGSKAFDAAAKNSPYGAITNNAYAGLDLSKQPQATTPPATSAQPPVAPAVVQNRYATQPPVAQQPLAQQPVAQQPAAPQTGAPALPPGSPPLGFEGFCTVSMKRDFRWVKGDAKWGAIHRGRTYLFAGQTERDEFLRNPDMYSPVLSGLDPVAAVEQNRSVPGRREFAVQYPPKSGQFYMFSTEENLNRFSANPAGFAEGIRQAMTTTGGGNLVR